MSKIRRLALPKGLLHPATSREELYINTVKAALKELNTPYFDECCDENNTLLPVAFQDEVLKQYDPETKTWIEVVTGGGGGGTTETASNGLTKVVDDIRLGGTLTADTYINTATSTLYLTKATVGNTLDVTNTGGIGIASTANVAFSGFSTAVPAWFTNTDTATNQVRTGLIVERAGFLADSGVGIEIKMTNPNSIGASFDSTLIRSKLTTANSGSESSSFELHLTDNGDINRERKLELKGSGQLRLDKYGINTFADTPTYALGTDAVGNVVEFAVGGSDTTTASNGLTETGDDIQLGAQTAGASPLLHNTYIDTDAYQLNILTTTSNNIPLNVNSTTGTALNVAATSGIGVFTYSASGTGLQATSDGGTYAGIFKVYGGANSSTVVPAIKALAIVDGPALAGFGTSINFELETTNFGTTRESNQLISKWLVATDATRTSSLITTGVYQGTSQDIAVFNGTSSGGSVGIGTLSPQNSKLVVQSSGDAYAMQVGNSSQHGIYSYTTDGNAYLGQSIGATAVINLVQIDSNTSNVTPVGVFAKHTSGTAANNLGGSFDYSILTTNGTSQVANQLIWKWTDATTATRTSQFAITGVSNAVTNTLLTVSGAGLFTLAQGLTNYADDAAASAGGIPLNGLYRNGSIVMIRVA